MKYFKFFTSLGLTILLSMSISANATNKTESLDRIVAVVNDSVITQSELNQLLVSAKRQLQASNVSLPPSDQLRKQVLDQLINKKIQLQLAEQMGVHVSDEEVGKVVSGIAADNKLSVNELYQKVAEQGVNKENYLKDIHEQLTIQKVQQQAVGPKLSISPEEVTNFMHSKSWQASTSKEYHLEDILIALPEAPTSQDVTAARKRADEVLIKIRGGMSFSQAAVAESGENSALQGGDLGWRKLPEIPAAFANQLVNMKANELLGPVQTPNGFHIVRLAGIRSAGTKSNPDMERKQVEQLIYQRKLEEALQGWLTKLRGEAFINTHPDSQTFAV
jgi:peptidyl-prolyl cis-trans isomerase SurA